MKYSMTESKKYQVISWIKQIRNSDSKVLVSNYCYDCFFTGNAMNKTLIVFPDEIEAKGIIAIDKPLSQVELFDIIKLYTRIKN